MSFTPEEVVKLRHHMGYLNVSEVSTFQMGIAASVETQYLIETAVKKVLPEAENLARNIVSKLDIIESQLVSDLELLAVNRVDEIEVNAEEMKKLRVEYRFWQSSLANLLGIPPNPYDQRFQQTVNVSVQVG